MKKKILKLLSLFLLCSLPFWTVFFYTEKISNQYNQTYLAEFNDKYDLLCSTNEKKIIFVGGSSLPFGLKSDWIEEEISGYKVVNFGLYATLGTKFMMDMSKANINPGDIVILSPEVNPQTYSLYFNPEAVLQACDGFAFKYKYLSFQDNLSLFYNYYSFSKEKIKYYANQNAPDPIGIYRHDSFNSYGDIAVEREYNIMNNGYDSTMSIEPKEDLLDSDFIRYVNRYCDYVRSRNAKIYFNFSPCNELAVGTTLEKRNAFQEKLNLSIRCDTLSDLEDCIMDYRYFYDTNFHLNSSGAAYYTNLIIRNLKKKLNIADADDTGMITPEPPSIKDEEVIEPEPVNPGELTNFNEYQGEANNDYLDYFEYRLVGSSYQIIGIKKEYRDIEEVILPSTYNGRNITTIIANAFYGCIQLKRIHIGLTYKSFEENSFNGCIALEGIYLYELDGNKLSPASTGLLEGTSKNVKIYVLNGSNYTNGYTWMNYSSYFEYFSRG